MERLGAEKVIYNADRLVNIKNKGDAYPVHMAIGLTDYCCHKCVFCNSEFATADMSRIHVIDKDVVLKFLGEAKDAGLKAVTICGSGEPLIYPGIESLLYAIHEMGLEIGIFTNASRMTSNIRKAILNTCTFLRCSVNASNRKEHEIVHRIKNDFDNVVANIASLVEEKKEIRQKLPTIGTQLVFYDQNYRSMYEAAELWKKVGVDYFEVKPVIEGDGSAVNITVFPALDTDAVLEQMKKVKELEDESFHIYVKYEQYLNTLSTENRNYKVCYGHALNPNLWSDGNVFICPNQEHENDIIGNIYESSFMEIWHGDKRKKRIQQIQVDKCPRGCRCDNLNKVIWDYLHPDVLVHPNFI